MSTNILKISLAVAVLTGLAQAQDRGVITGTVSDEHGTPVAKAKVLITEKGVPTMHRVLQFHETDADGHFRIAHVAWGTYIVTAGKENAGYTDTGLSLHCNNAYPTVALSEDSPTDDVKLTLGPKAGVLELEPVTDATTGNPIRLAAIRLICANNPDLYVYTSASQRRFLVPPLTEVLVEISAEGYKPWRTPGKNDAGRINLKAEEQHPLQVALVPEPPSPNHK